MLLSLLRTVSELVRIWFNTICSNCAVLYCQNLTEPSIRLELWLAIVYLHGRPCSTFTFTNRNRINHSFSWSFFFYFRLASITLFGNGLFVGWTSYVDFNNVVSEEIFQYFTIPNDTIFSTPYNSIYRSVQQNLEILEQITRSALSSILSPF